MTNNLIIGIDPGASGGACFAFIFENDKSIYLMDLNTTIKTFDLSDHKKFKISCYMESFVKSATDWPTRAAVYARNYGQWEGYLMALGIKINYIQPLKWQSFIAPEAVGNERNARKKVYQKIASKFIGKKVSRDLSDAVCIAKYVLEKGNGA